MNKRTALTLSGIVLAIAVMSVSTVMYFRYRNTPEAIEPLENQFSVSEADIPEKKETTAQPPIAPIKDEAPDVIEEPATVKPEDTVPPPEITETTTPDGTVVQTPNWEAQKELAPGTDLENPDKQPEYVQPAPKKQETPATSTPKNGSKKTENGATYTYLEGFGWVKDGNGGTTTHISGELSGEKVGY